jgi:hypothetical protein
LNRADSAIFVILEALYGLFAKARGLEDKEGEIELLDIGRDDGVAALRAPLEPTAFLCAVEPPPRWIAVAALSCLIGAAALYARSGIRAAAPLRSFGLVLG